MWKKLWRILGILAGVMLLTACGEPERQMGVDGYVYVPKAVRNYDKLDIQGIRSFCCAGGALYFGGRTEIYRIPVEEEIDFEKAEIIVSLNSTGDLEGDYILGYTVDEEQNIYFCTQFYNNPGFLVYKCSEDGNVIYRAPIDGTAVQNNRRDRIALDGEGAAYVLSADSLYRIDAEGENGGKLSLDGYLMQGAERNYLLKTDDNRLFLFSEAILGRKAYEVTGGASLELKPVQQLTEEMSSFRIYDGLLAADDDGWLYRLDADTGTKEKVLRWEDSNLYNDEKCDIVPAAEDSGFVVEQVDGASGTEGMLMVRTPVEELPERELIVLASISPSRDLKAAVVEFNRSSEKYHATIENYGAKVYENGTDAAVARLDVSLTEGNGPDLLDLSFQDFFNKYSEKGTLEDLYGYMEKDGDISKEDYLTNVLEAYSIDGKLSCIPQSFTAFLTYGTDAGLSDVGDWTMEGLMELAEKYPDRNLFPIEGGYGKPWIFMDRIYGAYYLEKYIDWEKGECSFDSEGFCRLLQWIDDQLSGRDKECLLEIGHFYSFSVWQEILATEGDETGLYGFPTANGRMRHYVMAEDMVGICAGSGHKEGAWEFLRFYLQRGNGGTFGFPTRIDRLKEMEDEAVEGALKSYMTINGRTVEIAPLKRESAHALYEFLEEIDFTPRSGLENTIVSIVTEESEAFFSGSKTAEETAKIIQNRVQLLIQENK